MVLKHQASFAIDGDEVNRTTLTTHKIETGDANRIRRTARRASVYYEEELDTLVHKMLAESVMKLPTSPVAASIVLAKGKDGSIRLCADYRQLNAVTRKHSFTLPRIYDTLNALAGAMWFTTLDLASGYWQVEVHSRTKIKQPSLYQQVYMSLR